MSNERDPRIFRRHRDVVRIAHDAEGFSNATSSHLQIPNGLDGPAHTRMRRLLEPFFAPAALASLEPVLRRRADDLVAELSDAGSFDAVEDLGGTFAIRAQSAWLGWGAHLEPALRDWVARYRGASRAGDAAAHAEVAAEFDRIIRGILEERRVRRRCDVTSLLMAVRTESGRRLRDDELISILRNWTGGDLASVAACAAVLVHWVLEDSSRAVFVADAADPALDRVIDEVLRCDDPFVSNRRRATRDAVVAGCPVPAGDVVVLDWRSANRDPEVFGDGFDARTHAAANLVYGSGVHVCPGRELATLQLRVLLRAFTEAGAFVTDPAAPAVREEPPLAGWRTLRLRRSR